MKTTQTNLQNVYPILILLSLVSIDARLSISSSGAFEAGTPGGTLLLPNPDSDVIDSGGSLLTQFNDLQNRLLLASEYNLFRLHSLRFQKFSSIVDTFQPVGGCVLQVPYADIYLNFLVLINEAGGEYYYLWDDASSTFTYRGTSSANSTLKSNSVTCISSNTAAYVVRASASAASSKMILFNQTSIKFYETTNIGLGVATTGWQFFDGGDVRFLAQSSMSGANNNVIYKWNDGILSSPFTPNPTVGSKGWEIFKRSNGPISAALAQDNKVLLFSYVGNNWNPTPVTISISGSGPGFLTVVKWFQIINSNNNGDYLVVAANSQFQVFKWSDSLGRFDFLSSKPKGFNIMELFTFNGNVYIIGTNNEGSTLYRWNTDLSAFDSISSVPFNNVTSWKYFQVGRYSYLLMTRPSDSYIYKINVF